MPSLGAAFARLRRVDHQLAEMQPFFAALVQENMNKFAIHREADGTVNFNYVGGSDEAVKDPSLSIIVGETIYNLRAALDYLIYELSALDSGAAQDGTQYPIFYSRGDFDRFQKSYLKGVSDPHVKCIEGLQPYHGYGWPCVLREISNPDKHRKLIFVQGQMSAVSNITVLTADELAERHRLSGAVHLPQPEPIILDDREGIPTIALEDGDAAVEVEMHVTFHIAFRDGTPIIETVQSLKAEIAALLELFEPEFKGA